MPRFHVQADGVVVETLKDVLRDQPRFGEQLLTQLTHTHPTSGNNEDKVASRFVCLQLVAMGHLSHVVAF